MHVDEPKQAAQAQHPKQPVSTAKESLQAPGTGLNTSASLWTGVLIILITLLGAVLRFHQIGKLSFWLDEVLTANWVTGTFAELRAARQINMSFFYLLAFGWNRLMPSTSEASLRALPALFSLGAIPATFFLAKNLLRPHSKAVTIGLLGALFMAVSPLQVQYAQEFRSYSLVTLLTLLSTLFFIKANQAEEDYPRWYLLYILSTAMAVYSHMHAVFIVVPQALFLVVYLRKRAGSTAKLLRSLGSLGAIALLLLPMAYLTLRKGSSVLAWIAEPSLQTLLDFFRDITIFREGYLFILFYLLAGLGFIWGAFWLGKQKRVQRWYFYLLLGCVILPPLLTFAVSKFLVPIFVARYVIYVLPYVFILSAAGIAALLEFGKLIALPRWLSPAIAFILVAVLAAGSVLGVESYYQNFEKEEWRQAAPVIAGECADSLSIVYPDWLLPCITYYEPGFVSIPAERLAQLTENESIPAGFFSDQDPDRVCLVFSHTQVGTRAQMADRIRSTVAEQYPQMERLEFNSIQIEIYER